MKNALLEHKWLARGCIAAVVLAAMIPIASARTVALWPIEDAAHGGFRSAIDPRHDFTNAGGSLTYPAQTVGWNLPPNPDSTSAYLFEPVNRTTVQSQSIALKNVSVELAECVLPTKNFTFEGFLYMTNLPEGVNGDTWRSVAFGAGSSGNQKTGWMVQMQYAPETDGTKAWIFAPWRGGASTPTMTVKVRENQLLNKWVHVAITYAADNGEGKNEFRFYLDGELVMRDAYGKRTTGVIVREGPDNGLSLAVGGRTDRPLVGQADYWRLSDETLMPGRFLNAGDSGTIVPDNPEVQPSTKTVSYWTLNNRDGALDARDHVGTAHLSDWYGDCIVSWPMSVHDDVAFSGTTPPNPHTTLKQANAGSFLNQNPNSYLLATNLFTNGAFDLSFSKPFTVEGWFKPVRRTASTPETQYFFSTRNNKLTAPTGWSLFMKTNDHRFHLIAQDNGKSGNLVSEKFEADITEWGETWKHIALSYDPAGTGTWKLYLDGHLAGSATNKEAPVADNASVTFLSIGGAYEARSGFFGAVDCVRVSAATLAGNQLMCHSGVDTAAATDVVALWPLDGAEGFRMDGHDEIIGTGNGLFNRTGYLYSQPLTRSTEHPSAVTNPDMSWNFVGDPTVLDGSAEFTHNGFKYLAGRDETLSSTIGNTGTWTLEGYLRRTGEVTGTFGVFFATYSTSVPNNAPTFLHGLNKATCDFMVGGSALAGTAPALNTWYHFAIVCENTNPGSKNTCTLYLNGEFKGSVTNTGAKLTVANSTSFSIGGMGNSPRSFPGQLCHLRLSKGALATNEFLCADKADPSLPPEVEKKTVAYWPLDDKDGTAVTQTLLEPSGYDLYEAANVAGDAAMARARVPNKAVPFDRGNAGSVLIGENGHVKSVAIGNKLDLLKAWTVEGWVKGSSANVGARTLCGTYGSSFSGWRLTAEIVTGEPKFALLVRPGSGYTPCLDAEIRKTGELAWDTTGWNHVALVHNPRLPSSEWTLYVNGKRYGSIGNDWPSGYLTTDALEFGLGSIGGAMMTFEGGYDMWRVSAGLLDPDDLLYRTKQGLVMFFR